MTPRQFYYPVVLSITEVRESLGDIVEMAGLAQNQINLDETIRLMLADYFYGELAVSAYRTITHNDRSLAIENSAVVTIDENNAARLIHEVNNLFWILCDLIGTQALVQTAEYQHRPSECFYTFHEMEGRVTVYVPVLDGLTLKPNIAPVPISAIIVACSRTLPTAIRLLMKDEPIINHSKIGAGDY